jgi:hypothetical protein
MHSRRAAMPSSLPSVSSVWKKAGERALTRMPRRPVHSWARSRVRPMSPALAAAGGEPDDAGDVDDRASLLQHFGGCSSHPGGAAEVDVDHLAEPLGAFPQERRDAADPGIVNEDVEPSEVGTGVVDRPLAGLLVRKRR